VTEEPPNQYRATIDCRSHQSIRREADQLFVQDNVRPISRREKETMENPNPAVSAVTQQSDWYGAKSRSNRAIFVRLKMFQLLMAAAIPVIAVASAGDIQRWTNAILGALIGIIEGLLQLGQFQQNWLLYRTTREALKSEALLHSALAGPYADITDPDSVYVVRCDSIMLGERSKWLTTQQQVSSSLKATGPK
jgi:hypothetical protein